EDERHTQPVAWLQTSHTQGTGEGEGVEARGRRSPAISGSCPTAASLTGVGLRFERPFVYHGCEHAYAGDPGQAAAACSGFLRSPGPTCLRAAGTRPGRITDRQAPGAVRRAARVLAPGEPDTAPGAGPGPLRQGIAAVGRPGDRRAAPGRSRPRAAAGRLRGRGAAAGSLPARPGRRAGAAALRLKPRMAFPNIPSYPARRNPVRPKAPLAPTRRNRPQVCFP